MKIIKCMVKNIFNTKMHKNWEKLYGYAHMDPVGSDTFTDKVTADKRWKEIIKK